MNLSEFLKKIELIDQELAKERFSIHIRPLKAFHLMGPEYEGPLLGYGVNPEKFPEFAGPNLLSQIQDWYEQRYGERIFVPTDRGKLPIIIRGEIYLIRIPLVFGKPEVSILPLVEGLTENMAKTLTTEELKIIQTGFVDGYALIYELEDLFSYLEIKGLSFIGTSAMALLQSAFEDRETATRCLSRQLDTNGACFHSQQHTEKMLKAYLLSKGLYSEKDLSRSPFGHNLTRIHQACVGALPEFVKAKVDVETLSQFSMDIRYTSPNPTNPQNRIPISVEDVMAYFDLAKNKFGIKGDEELSQIFTKFIESNPQIHPLALGNVNRIHTLIRILAKRLLKSQKIQLKEDEIEKIVNYFTEKLYSHQYLIGRKEAEEDLGIKTVVDANDILSKAMTDLYEEYNKELVLLR